MKYLTVNEVIVIHEYLIDEFGGSSGLRDLPAFESNKFRFKYLFPWLKKHIKSL